MPEKLENNKPYSNWFFVEAYGEQVRAGSMYHVSKNEFSASYLFEEQGL